MYNCIINIYMIDSGTKDIHGNFIPESDTAKLRNHLSSFWTLVDLCELQKNSDKDTTELLNRLIETCKQSQVKVTDIIKSMEKQTITGYRMDCSGKVWTFDQYKYHIMSKRYTQLPLDENIYITMYNILIPVEIKIID